MNIEAPNVVEDTEKNTVSYLGVEVPKGVGGRLVPKASEFKEEYFYLEGHHTLMREVATALLLNKPILLEGGTGVYNKTTTIARMCRDLNMNYCKVNFDRETAREDVIGGQTLKIDENGKEHLQWYDGDLLYAIRNGGIAFLDEYNRQSKLAGIINPILDAILNGRKEITNPYNENERVTVHPDFRLVAAQNPPGMEDGHEYTDRSQLSAETFGRWIYKKLPITYTEAEENKLLAGVIGEEVELQLSEAEFRHVGQGLPVRELAQIPGMTHWRMQIISIIRVLEAKSTGAKREMARGQRQSLSFNPRLIYSTIPQYVARFYRGDINETIKNAFETCVIGMYAAEADKQKIRLMLSQAEYKPEIDRSKRKGLERKESKRKDTKEKATEEIELSADSDPTQEMLKTAEKELVEFVRSAREIKREVSGELDNSLISADYRYEEGGEQKSEHIDFEFDREIYNWLEFYKKNGIKLSEEKFRKEMSGIWDRNYDAMRVEIEKFGFDEILFISGGLKLPDLHAKMSEGYEKTVEGDNFKEDGSFKKVQEVTSSPRIVLVHKKDAQNLADHHLLKKTRDQTAKEFIDIGESLALTDYLVYQRQYFQETGKHLDQSGWTWLPGSRGGARVVVAGWSGDRLRVCADAPGYSAGFLGCRLSRSFL